MTPQHDAHYVVELAGQSHEQHRDDLANHDVITVPVVAGPFREYDTALDHQTPAHHTSTDGYAVVTVPEDDPDYVDTDTQ